MRRSILALALSVLCLVLAPVSAHAFFWKWLDDLSGPQFAGINFELKLWCLTQSAAARQEMLRAVKRRLEAERLSYERGAMISHEPAAFYYRVAVILTAEAIAETERVLAGAGGGQAADKEQVDAAMAKVVSLRILARVAADAKVDPAFRDDDVKRLTEWLDDLQKSSRSSQEAQNAEAFRAEVLTRARALFLLPVSGFVFSACPLSYHDVDRAFVSATAGFGWDTKDANQGKGNMMATVGASAHWVIVPAVTVGAGAGVARFFVGSRKDFWKGYLQPVIVDVRPLTLYFRNPRFRSPWAHTVYIRYSGTTFPGGFKAGLFEPDQPAYKTEYISSFGIYFDTEPLFRNKQRKWWKDHP